MATCGICNEEFPRLEQGSRCGRCLQRKPGMCAPELKEINNKPQCCGCGLSTHALKQPLCSTCLNYYGSADSVPRSLLSVSGVAKLLSAHGSDSEPQSGNPDAEEGPALTEDIIDVAEQYRAGTSSQRLGRPKVATQGISGSLKQFQKGRSVTTERKEKKAENEASRTGVRISGQVWLMSKSNGKPMKPLVGCKCDKVVGLNDSTQSALDKVLLELCAAFLKHYPKANPLKWSLITLYAHENQGSYSLLQESIRKQPVSKLLALFRESGWGAKKALEDRKIAIRFMVVQEETLPDDDDYDEWDGPESSSRMSRSSRASSKGTNPKAAPSSKRKRDSDVSSSRAGAANSAVPKSRTGEFPSKPPVPIPDWSKHAPAPRMGSVQLAANQVLSSARAYQSQHERQSASLGAGVRRSAYYHVTEKKSWTRTPKILQPHTFYKHTASCNANGIVKFTKSDVEFTIQLPLPSEWQGKQSVAFVGEGATKLGIYARYRDTEYVITQLKDEHASQYENKDILTKEMELLCKGDWFKKRFDEEAELKGVYIPQFEFNFGGSFLGELKLSETSGSRALPLTFFIATPLLPCGELDTAIRKFTGNDQIGRIDSTMTELIHSFTHFTYLYSGGNLIFCDLQGMLNKDNIMSLIDPQIHTRSARDNRHAYWDGGPELIDELLRQHEEGCRYNHYCGKLELREAIPFGLASAALSSRSPPRKRTKEAYEEAGEDSGNKKPINFMLNSAA